MLNLDTHILLFALSGQVTAAERKILSADDWSISAIVLWEIARLAELRRISVDLEDREVARVLSRIHTWPSTSPCAATCGSSTCAATRPTISIAATSLAHQVSLVTRDKRLRRSKKVPLAR